MRIPEVLDIIKRCFSSNGYIDPSKGVKVRLSHPTNMSLKVENGNVVLLFDKKSLPVCSYEVDLKFIKPAINRKVLGVSFGPKEFVIMLDGFPDLPISYS